MTKAPNPLLLIYLDKEFGFRVPQIQIHSQAKLMKFKQTISINRGGQFYLSLDMPKTHSSDLGA